MESVMWPRRFSIRSILLSLLFPLLSPRRVLPQPSPPLDHLQYKNRGDELPQFLQSLWTEGFPWRNRNSASASWRSQGRHDRRIKAWQHETLSYPLISKQFPLKATSVPAPPTHPDIRDTEFSAEITFYFCVQTDQILPVLLFVLSQSSLERRHKLPSNGGQLPQKLEVNICKVK